MTSLAAITLLSNCGPAEPVDNRVYSETGAVCSVEQIETGAVVRCPDGSEAYIHNGADGADGANGTNCSVEPAEQGAIVRCGDYEQTIYHGRDGAAGKNYHDQLIYEGYGCGRTIVSLDRVFYMFSGQLIELSNKWTKVTSTCSIRIRKNKIETK